MMLKKKLKFLKNFDLKNYESINFKLLNYHSLSNTLMLDTLENNNFNRINTSKNKRNFSMKIRFLVE